MMRPEFWFARSNQRFAEATVRKTADQLQRPNDNIEALVPEMRQQREARTNGTAAAECCHAGWLMESRTARLMPIAEVERRRPGF